MMLSIPTRQLNILLEILADYLRLVGKDPARMQRIRTAKRLLAQWGIGFVLVLALSLGAFGKDRQYETGTLSRHAVSAGYSDTTNCYPDASHVWHCAGGIREEVAVVYTLTLADGQSIQLSPAPLHRNGLVGLPDGAVQYRIHRSMGRTFIKVVGAEGKEGTYMTEDKFNENR